MSDNGASIDAHKHDHDGHVWYDDLMMRLAIEAAKRSPPIQSAYCVGAVLLRVTPSSAPLPATDASTKSISEHKHGHGAQDLVEVLATGYSRELDGNTHAEECALLKFVAVSLSSLPSSPFAASVPSSRVLQRHDTLTDLAPLLAPVSSSLSTRLGDYYRSLPSSSVSQWPISSSLSKQLFDQTNKTPDNHNHAPISSSSSRVDSQPYFVVYTTMEPCSHRLSGKVPCSQLISACGRHSTAAAPSASASSTSDILVGRVIVGVTEPDLFVKCTGIHQLSDDGIDIVSTTPLLQSICSQLNKHLTDNTNSTTSTITTPPVSSSVIVSTPSVPSVPSLLPIAPSIIIASH